jgi:hypothetical protein
LQTRLTLHRFAHRGLVEDAIRLRSGGAHGRPLAAVEDAEMDAGTIGRARHQTTQGVDLLDQMTLADAADGRIAAHLADGLDIVRQQQGAGAEARRRKRGLGTGMAAADDDHVILPFCQHRSIYLRGKVHIIQGSTIDHIGRLPLRVASSLRRTASFRPLPADDVGICRQETPC